MSPSIVVPTYRRAGELLRCLEGIAGQTRLPEEVAVVVRVEDRESREALASRSAEAPPVRVVDVDEPGQVAALNAGLEAVEGDVVAFLDDDAVPHGDWLERIVAHYRKDPRVGAVGGRDRMLVGEREVTGAELVVGVVRWYGHVVGHHHVGVGKAREVDALKGTNMSFRSDAIAGLRFDRRLRGRGAQYRNDLAMCLAVRRRGWKVVYDPAVLVDHHLAARHELDQRGEGFAAEAVHDCVHNTSLCVLEHLSWQGRAAFLAWSVLVGGSRHMPGLAQALRSLPRERGLALARLGAAWAGLAAGWRTYRAGRRPQGPLDPSGA